MFNATEMLALLKVKPFVPFRLILSDGAIEEVQNPKFVLPARQFAVIGMPDPTDPDTFIVGWTILWYMQVVRVKQLHQRKPPTTGSAGPADSNTPSAV